MIYGEYIFKATSQADDREATARGWDEVVRCKDCKYCEVKNRGVIYAVCKKHDHKFYSFDDDTRECFCSWAERKEG